MKNRKFLQFSQERLQIKSFSFTNKPIRAGYLMQPVIELLEKSREISLKTNLKFNNRQENQLHAKQVDKLYNTLYITIFLKPPKSVKKQVLNFQIIDL